MNIRKKTVSVIVLISIVLVLMTGCNNQNSVSPTPSASVSPIAASPEVSGNSTDEGANSATSYPIVTDGSITLEYWWPLASEVSQYTTDYTNGKNYAFTGIMKATGINLSFIYPVENNLSEEFNLLIASNDYPDLIKIGMASYPGGGDKAIEDGVWLRLNELLDKYAPNYMKWVNSSEANKKNSITDLGNRYGFGQVYDRLQPTFIGFCIRQDWLDDLGLAMPVTMTQWHDVLSSFKANKTDGGYAPLEIAGNGFALNNAFHGAYGVSNEGSNYLIQENDVVRFSVVDDGYRDYLEMMHTWYSEGLIDTDFVVNGGTGFAAYFPNNSMVSNNKTGATSMMYTYTGTYLADNGITEKGSVWNLCPPATLDSGETPKVAGYGKFAAPIGLGAGMIFTTCKYPEEAVRFMDYFYSEEGALLTNYGVEGVTFNYDENGKPKQTELMAKNPDGMTTTTAQAVYLIHNGPVVFYLDREEDAQSDMAKTYNQVWNVKGDWNVSGALTYTTDEASRRSSLVNDLTTYVNEFNCKIIMGETELTDQTWDAFKTQVKKMGSDEVVSITQAAYDRFRAR